MCAACDTVGMAIQVMVGLVFYMFTLMMNLLLSLIDWLLYKITKKTHSS